MTTLTGALASAMPILIVCFAIAVSIGIVGFLHAWKNRRRPFTPPKRTEAGLR